MMLQNLLADRFKLAVHRETRASRYTNWSWERAGKIEPYVANPNAPSPEPG